MHHCAKLVPFNPDEYFKWLGSRQDSPALRAHWAAEAKP